jgi:lipopolysaccharide export system permease protein
MLTSIWERYFLKEFLKVFFLFLFCFYGLYILIDYAGHTSSLPHHRSSIPPGEIVRYYLYIFASRAEILIPFAILLAFIKTICTLNTHQELVALLASGVPLKKLLRPFFLIAFICTALLFLNEQFLLPLALKKLRHLKDLSKHLKGRRDPDMAVHPMILEDGTLFLFQSYDTDKKQFFDVYWIRTIDHIYRIKFLSPSDSPPKGYLVDQLVRLPNGELTYQGSFKEFVFSDMHFNQDILQSALIDPEALSLTNLWNRLPHLFSTLNEKESKLLTAFYWKMLLPWLCVLAILASAPFCVKFSRQLPTFLIYVGGMFGLIAFYLGMDAAQVVAKRQVMQPFLAICVPFFLFFSYFSYRYFKQIR